MTTALDAIRALRELRARCDNAYGPAPVSVYEHGHCKVVDANYHTVADCRDVPCAGTGEENAALVVAMWNALHALLDVAEAAEEMRKALASPVGGLRREMLLGAAQMQLDDALSALPRGKEGGQ